MMGLQACTYRKPGSMSGACSFKFVGAAEVIACGNIDIVGWKEVNAENNVICQFPAETAFTFRVEIIMVGPPCQVFQCKREPERRFFHALCETYLQVKWQMLRSVFMKGRELSSDILQNQSGTEVFLFLKVM